jgi:hypothetical protein
MTRRILLPGSICRGGLTGRWQSFGLLLLLAGSTANGASKSRIELDPNLQFSDMAVLASREPRADFSCQVTSEKPSLGFDLRFHSDYRATVPIRVLADAGGWVQVAMRLTPIAEGEETVYLVHRFAVPAVPLGAKGQVMLAGGFGLGLGRYRLDWMMRDARERVCSSHWDLEAKPPHGQRDLPLTLGPNKVADLENDASGDGLQVKQDLAQPLRVKILLNLSPAKPQGLMVKPEDATVLFSMLRSITGQPGITRFTLVAFNLREQKIVYRQEDADQVDFVALGRAIQSPTAGTIDYRLLRDPQSETRFVTRLLTDQLGAQPDSPDAIIIVGPKVTLDGKVPLGSLKMKGAAMCPVFYLNYNPNPFDEPWADTIGSALKAYKGALAYDIALPRDLAVAMRDLLRRSSPPVTQ